MNQLISQNSLPRRRAVAQKKKLSQLPVSSIYDIACHIAYHTAVSSTVYKKSCRLQSLTKANKRARDTVSAAACEIFSDMG